MGWGASCVVCSLQRQTTTVISDSRGGRGPPPLGIPEQEPPAASTTSEGTKEEDIVMEHHLFLLLLPQEYTRPLLPLPNVWQVPRCLIIPLLQLGAALTGPPVGAKQDKVLLAWSTGGRGKPPHLSLTPVVGKACHH